MGLEERRRIKELQDVTIPGRLKEIEEITGAHIPYDIDWSTFADDAPGLNFLDNVSCHRLNMALRVICSDALGKDAVKDGLKSIKIQNIKDKSAKKLTFDAGILTMQCAYASGLDGAFSDNEIRAELMKKL